MMYRLLSFLLLLSGSQISLAAEWPVTIHWAEMVTLSTPLTGKVSEVSVVPGQRVKQGEALLKLDPRLFQAELKRAESTLKRNQQNFAEAQRAYDRAKELFDRTVLSTTELQNSELALAVATASLRNSEADVSQAKVNLEYCRLLAPFDGIVAERLTHPGETVSGQMQVQPLLRLARQDVMRAEAWLPADRLDQLQPGQIVELGVREKRMQAIIKTIGMNHREASNAEEFSVILHFTPPADLAIFPGMTGFITLP
jgi:multidrug efflux system membrane fusion protein